MEHGFTVPANTVKVIRETFFTGQKTQPTILVLVEFLDEIYLTKTRGMGLPYRKNFVILTSTVFYDPPV